jgi:hypothetical protein
MKTTFLTAIIATVGVGCLAATNSAHALCVVNYIPDASVAVSSVKPNLQPLLRAGKETQFCTSDSDKTPKETMLQLNTTITTPDNKTMTCTDKGSATLTVKFGYTVVFDRYDRDNVYKVSLSEMKGGVSNAVGEPIVCVEKTSSSKLAPKKN